MTRNEIEPWDSDHTALVHVLWSAQHAGITIDDADELAAHIMRSKWMKAVRLHALEKAADDALEEQRADRQESAEVDEFVRKYA